MKQFTFSAPVKYLDTTGTDLKTITQTYEGASTIWIGVDAETQKLINYAGEGSLPKPEDTESTFYVLLSQENPNQVILMDMLSGCRGNVEPEIVDEIIHTFADTGFVVKYPRWENENTLHTYELTGVTVSRDGLVTYPWKQPHITLDQLKLAVTEQINLAQEQLNKLSLPNLRLRYEKVLDMLYYIKNNLLDGSVSPWKINLPTADDV